MDDENWEAQMNAMMDSDRSFLVGISTWDEKSCDSTTPTVYSNVKPYLGSIKENSYNPKEVRDIIEQVKDEPDKDIVKTITAAELQKLKKDFKEWNEKRIQRIKSETTDLSHQRIFSENKSKLYLVSKPA